MIVLNMDKLKSYLDLWADGKKVSGIKTPPLETIYELINIYNGVQKETINLTVVDVLKKCKIEVETRGIGWRVKKR